MFILLMLVLLVRSDIQKVFKSTLQEYRFL